MTIMCECPVVACAVWCGMSGSVFCLRCRTSLPVDCHTGLLLWQCRHTNLSTVRLAVADVQIFVTAMGLRVNKNRRIKNGKNSDVRVTLEEEKSGGA